MSGKPSGGNGYKLKRMGGFTVVETLIVMAVTGLLFLSVALMVAGRQNRTEFVQAIQNVQSQLQQTMNEVSTGFYPNKGDFHCDASSPGTAPRITDVATAQGTNQNCIFLGKIVHFDGNTSDPQKFYTYTVTGRQTNTTNGDITQLVSTMQDAKPIVVAPGTRTNIGYPDESETQILQYGLHVGWMRYYKTTSPADSGVDTGSVGFISGLSAYDVASGQLVSGTQQINLLPIARSGTLTSSIDNGSKDEVDDINGFLPSNTASDPTLNVLNPPGGVKICFVSGGTDQSGLVTLGSSGRALAVKLDIFSGTTCS